ncbi:Lrp/AsnC ligand binding domain-containing protein [Chitiniphilus purpureus]|uniref:Lrp/AsnC ligand binding domain-containing protein n=1 Tax=Chitiniphilus purpureus TaxID=2981137 RepID=A0ABY6DR76_9NEIS|nr:Lrp/AsnC ligand binding domain-containing protein [Chitiniphilus sp. CD1]UXY15986.1 Lrp/AsnC ligand binding domain-containing protein [Chitiniphilus sp. CD1]
MRTRYHGGRELDRIDHKILRALQHNARLSITELAEQVGLTATPCAERVKRLEETGVILGYHARLNPQKLAAPLLVFVELKLSRKSSELFDDLRHAVAAIPEVLECHLIAGDFDYLLKARLPDMSHYRRLLGDILLRLPGAAESRSYIVMEEVKETLALPLPD